MTYAIIKTGGRQFRVAEGDTLDVDLLDVEPGKTATFGDVLCLPTEKTSVTAARSSPGQR
jgi:large subunit ribosomal protein L21